MSYNSASAKPFYDPLMPCNNYIFHSDHRVFSNPFCPNEFPASVPRVASASSMVAYNTDMIDICRSIPPARITAIGYFQVGCHERHYSTSLRLNFETAFLKIPVFIEGFGSFREGSDISEISSRGAVSGFVSTSSRSSK